MFKNYLLLALKVLRRKPFYTFVSLFGISFTLMILMLITSMGDAMFGANQPMTDIDRMVFLRTVERYTPYYDTTYVVDSILMDSGVMRYDSTPTIEDSGRMTNQSSGSYHFMDNNLRDLEDVESYTFFSNSGSIDAYLDGRKVSLSAIYAEASYWDVFDFSFIAGLPFSSDDVTGTNKVAVMTERSAEEYFGVAAEQAIGQEVELGDERFRIVGVVERPLMDNHTISGDIILPITTIDQKKYDNQELGGDFDAVFKATTASKKESVIRQLNFYAENFDMPPDQEFENLGLPGMTHLQLFARDLVYTEEPQQAIYILFIPLLMMILLFVALPLINLINLNISRIFERKSEIAVRKAFGANSRDILAQFILENLVLTFIGGAAGLLLAYFIIQYVNANDLLGSVRLSFSPKLFIYFLLLIACFGLLSGLLPAYRMSRTNISTSLR